MSGSQDQKERKTASTVTTIFFFKQKITTAQIRFCNYRFPSRFDEWNNNEHINMT